MGGGGIMALGDVSALNVSFFALMTISKFCLGYLGMKIEKKRFTKVKNLYYKLTKGLNELTPPCSICRLMRSVSFYLLSECIFTGDLCIHECCIVKLYVQIKGPKLFS